MTMLKMDYRAVQLVKMGPRVEHHGDETVRAVDLTFSFTTDNTVLDGLADGLRLAYYKHDGTQEQLPGTEMPKVLRWPEVKAVKWEELVKDVIFTVHSVVHDEPDLVFAESKVGKVRIMPKEGGSVTIAFDAQVYAQPLQMSRLYSLLDDACKVSWREMNKDELDALASKQQALFPSEPPADGAANDAANDDQAPTEGLAEFPDDDQDCTVRINGQEVSSASEAEQAATVQEDTGHVSVPVPSRMAKAIRRQEAKATATKDKPPAKKAPAKKATAPKKKAPARKPAKERPSAGGAA